MPCWGHQCSLSRGNPSRPKFSLDLGLEQVYGRDSVTWRTRYVPVMQSRYVRFLAAVLGFSISSLCLAACGSSGASSSTTVTTSPASKAIVTAWFAAQKAFHVAALTSNPNSPDLAATMVPPQLDRCSDEPCDVRIARDIGARGPTLYGKPRVRTVTWATRLRSSSCVHGEEIEVDSKTGKPVAGVLGQSSYELIRSEMRRTKTGWKLADQTVAVGSMLPSVRMSCRSASALSMICRCDHV